MTQTADPVLIGGGRAVRPATFDDVAELRRLICEAIDTSPYYNAGFKAYEKTRLSADFLRALIEADPWYVPMISFKGQVAGFVLSIPDNGVLWATWVYIEPRFRDTAVALAAIGFLIRHWQNGRFHKISCFIRPENARSVAVMTHFGFAQTALLKTHMFGEDYLLLERPLTRSASAYDPPVLPRRIAMLRLRTRHALGKLGLRRLRSRQ